MKNGKRLTISRNLERQLREHLYDGMCCLDCIPLGEYGRGEKHAQKAKYLLDQLDKARRGKR